MEALRWARGVCRPLEQTTRGCCRSYGEERGTINCPDTIPLHFSSSEWFCAGSNSQKFQVRSSSRRKVRMKSGVQLNGHAAAGTPFQERKLAIASSLPLLFHLLSFSSRNNAGLRQHQIYFYAQGCAGTLDVMSCTTCIPRSLYAHPTRSQNLITVKYAGSAPAHCCKSPERQLACCWYSCSIPVHCHHPCYRCRPRSGPGGV